MSILNERIEKKDFNNPMINNNKIHPLKNRIIEGNSTDNKLNKICDRSYKKNFNHIELENYEYNEDNNLFNKTGKNFRDDFKDQMNNDKSFFKLIDKYNFKKDKMKNFKSKQKETKKNFSNFSTNLIDNNVNSKFK
jgi:hypothetical protein